MLVGLILLALAAAAPASTTSLEITVWPEGRSGRAIHSTLRCAPPRGTVPNPASACRRLAALDRPFRPVPRPAVCTMIYGGPATAFVRGTHKGRAVRAWFNRRDGCEIARWDRVRFLFQRG